MAFLQGARAPDWLKIPELPAWWRRKDKSAERRAAAARVPRFLITGCFVAAFAAAAVEVGFLTVWCIRAVGDIDLVARFAGGSEDGAGDSSWAFSLTLHPILFALLLAACAVIVWFSLFWIPAQLALRGQGFWRRVSLTVVGLFCNLIILSGVVSTGHANRVEDLRDDAVAAERVAISRDQIVARIGDIDEELNRLCDRTRNNDYNAAACNAGEEAYRATAMAPDMLAREEPARRRIIERAVQSAMRADALRAERQQLRADLVAAPTQASVATDIEDEAGAGVAALANQVDAYRPVSVGLGLSLIGILGSFWGFGLMQAAALLDPTAPERETPSSAASPEGEEISAPPDELDLPALADWRALEDPEFAHATMMVDEQGRKLKRVAGHWRPADDRAAPAGRDARRAADPAPETPPAEAAQPGPGNVDDLMERLLRGETV